MIGIEKLIRGLAASIILYRDSQVTDNKLITESNDALLKRKARAMGSQIINNAEVDFVTKFTSFIESFAKIYPARIPPFYFLLNKIAYLKPMLDSKQPFATEELVEYKKQVKQMIVDIKELLLKTKAQTYKVTYSKIGEAPQEKSDGKCSLGGFYNDAWGPGTCFTRGGMIFASEILNPIGIATDTANELRSLTADEIGDIADSLCNEHQNELLRIEHTKALAAAKVQGQTDLAKITEQTATLAAAEKQRLADLAKIAEQTKALAAAEQQHQSDVSRLSAQDAIISTSDPLKKIKALEDSLRLAHSRSILPLMFGGGGLSLFGSGRQVKATPKPAAASQVADDESGSSLKLVD